MHCVYALLRVSVVFHAFNRDELHQRNILGTNQHVTSCNLSLHCLNFITNSPVDSVPLNFFRGRRGCLARNSRPVSAKFIPLE